MKKKKKKKEDHNFLAITDSLSRYRSKKTYVKSPKRERRREG